MDASDILDLFSGSDGQAQTSAAALAQAIRQRKAAATLGAITGDPAMASVAKQFSGDADALQQGLLSAAQHRPQMDLQRQHLGLSRDQMANQLAQHAQQFAETERHNRAAEANQRLVAQQSNITLTPEGEAVARNVYRTTGQLPNLGNRAVAAKARIINGVGAEDPTINPAANAAQLAADKSSLSKQTGLLDLTKSWEATGKANLGVLRETAKQLADAGSPILNKPLRWAYQNMAGDPIVAKFKAAHAAVVNEYAKILSGNTGGGGITEGARHEAEAMFPLDATLGQIAAASDILEADAGNRLRALENQVGETRARITGKKAEAAAPAPAKATHRFNPATGKIEAIP